MAGTCARHPPNCDAAAHIGQKLVLWRAITTRTTKKKASTAITPQLGPCQCVPNQSVVMVAMTAMIRAVAMRRSVTPPRNQANAHRVGNAKTWRTRPAKRNDFIAIPPQHRPTRLSRSRLAASRQALPAPPRRAPLSIPGSPPTPHALAWPPRTSIRLSRSAARSARPGAQYRRWIRRRTAAFRALAGTSARSGDRAPRQYLGQHLIFGPETAADEVEALLGQPDQRPPRIVRVGHPRHIAAFHQEDDVTQTGRMR